MSLVRLLPPGTLLLAALVPPAWLAELQAAADDMLAGVARLTPLHDAGLVPVPAGGGDGGGAACTAAPAVDAALCFEWPAAAVLSTPCPAAADVLAWVLLMSTIKASSISTYPIESFSYCQWALLNHPIFIWLGLAR